MSPTLHHWSTRYHQLRTLLLYRPFFRKLGRGSQIRRPLLIYGAQHIEIGNHVCIRDGARLEALNAHPHRTPALRIGDNTNIEQNAHIICHSRVTIGHSVGIAPQCCIVDVNHPYQDLSDPRKVSDRISDEDSFVEIGDRAFLGFGVVVLPNVRIGEQAIIGALSVVTRDVPPRSVASGSPARIIRHFDPTSQTWEKNSPLQNR